MCKVTIVANEFSEETKRELQKEADKLAKENYSAHAIMHHFASVRRLQVNLYSASGQLTLNCKAVCK